MNAINFNNFSCAQQFSLWGVEEDQGLILPFLKWVGGKRDLMGDIRSRMPARYRNYFEPFVGGGAVMWDVVAHGAVDGSVHINDANEDLVDCYRAVRDDVEGVLHYLVVEDFVNDEGCFLFWRGLDRTEFFRALPAALRAARFIYLNKTCFNGLCRYNRLGQFNASFGRYSAPFAADRDRLRACSAAMRRHEVEISSGCFSRMLDRIGRGDFVYLDPPYVPLSATADFTSYTKDKFDAEMQFKLRDFCDALTERGALFMLSNSNADFTHQLYDGYRIDEVETARRINCQARGRSKVTEVLVRNY